MNDRAPSDDVQQQARVSDRGRSYQAGKDQYVSHIGTQHVWGPGSGPAPRALASLPPAPWLTGREERTDELLKALAPGGAGTAVTVVTGLPGVGKSALTLHAAHQAVSRGHFPGGTLFVHLRGYDPAGPVNPEQALESLLRALGVRDRDLPATVEEQAGLYQSELARRAEERGPVLIVADDASSLGQLRPLVPAHRGHRLLATSRDALTAPDVRARLVPLDELDTESATALIATALAQVRPDDVRAGAESRALEQVAGDCGRLPLALTIAAALLTDDPGLPIATLADDLADARTRLRTLRYEDGDGRSLAVQAAFDLSYRRLRKQDARLFRLLSLNPGPDLSLKTATALNGREERETRASLAALVRACLINEQPTGSGRWRAHDLIRLYAAELPQEEGEDGALERLVEHYTDTCNAADAHVRAPIGGPSTPALFPDRTAALAWLDAERANLIAMVLHAAADRPWSVPHLADALDAYLTQRRHFQDAITINEAAVAAARGLGDRHNEGRALNNLGNALQEVRRFDEAIHAHSQDLGICRELDDRHSEGQTLNNLGLAFQEVQRYDDAIRAHTEAIAIHRDIGDRHSEGKALNNLGLVLRKLRRYDEAIDAHTQDLAICRELGERHDEGKALNNLGLALRRVGRYREAVDAHTQDLAICRELGDRYGEGQALSNLGLALRRMRRYDEAVHAHSQAVVIFSEFDDAHDTGAAQEILDAALLEIRRRRWWRGWRGRRRPGGAAGPEA
ncbi:tetratricopeptide repeat protein [Streptomyces sp. YH02]|uniref:tetratricopeptide repeat protein n=1 Tax=Streptomyces sp. YH02 TaxID=3256999 RepID=UPI0037566A85